MTWESAKLIAAKLVASYSNDDLRLIIVALQRLRRSTKKKSNHMKF
jgi:hypothetical protein